MKRRQRSSNNKKNTTAARTKKVKASASAATAAPPPPPPPPPVQPASLPPMKLHPEDQAINDDEIARQEAESKAKEVAEAKAKRKRTRPMQLGQLCVVGLMGKAGAGKSTLAAALVKRCQFVEMSFADALKQGLASTMGIPVHKLYDPKTKPKIAMEYLRSANDDNPLTYRVLMQRFGDAIRKEFGGEVFVRIMKNRVEMLAQQQERIRTTPMEETMMRIGGGGGTLYKGIVISDVRLPCEAEFIRSVLGGDMVRIVRKTENGSATYLADADAADDEIKNQQHSSSMLTNEEASHNSETLQSGIKCDAHVINGGKIRDLDTVATLVASVASTQCA